MATINIGRQWEAVADTDDKVREAIEIKKNLYAKLPRAEVALHKEELGSDLDKVVDISDDVYFAAVRCQSAQDVSDFVDELDAQASDAADEIWAYLGSNEFTAIMLINGAWLPEVKATSPDWEKVLRVLDKVAAAALAKHADHLVAGAYRSKAIVLKEYASDKGDALETINEGVQELGYAHPALQDYLAKIYMLEGRYADAIRTWQHISPESESRKTTWRIFSHRDGLMCAGFLADWPSVAEFTLQGEKVARRIWGEVVAVGYMAEHALALWKSGDYATAVNEFAQILNKLKTLPNPNIDPMSYALHARVFVAVKWFAGNAKEGVEPQLGIFSDPSPPDVARENDIPREVFYAVIGTQLDMLKLKYLLRSFSLDTLMSQCAHLLNHSKELAESQNAFIPVPAFNGRMINNLLFAAIVNWIGRSRIGELPFGTWREDAGAKGILENDLDFHLDFLQKAVDAHDKDLRAILDDPQHSSDRRLVASLLLSDSDSLTPEDRFVANLFLVLNGNAYEMWREETEKIIAELIGRTWMAVVKEQRSSLLAPFTNVTRIISAIEDSSCSGIAKASRILSAVRPAVNVRLDDHTIDKLLELAK